MWTRELHKQDHLHVNVQRHCMGCNRKWWVYVSIIHSPLKNMQKDFFAVIGLSWCLDPKRSGTELTMTNQMDLGIERRRKCRRISKIPVIRYSDVPVPWREDNSRSKSGGKTTIHFNGSTENIELLHQMVISVNQLSLYGAVADMFAELPIEQRAPEKPIASSQLDKQEILTQPPLAELHANEERQGNLLQEYEERFEKLSEVIQTILRSRFEIGRSWTIIPFSSVTKRRRKSIFMPRIYVASRSKRN